MSDSLPPSATAAERKAALRERLRDDLAAMDPDVAQEHGKRVAAEVLSLPEVATAEGVLTCLSFGLEIDTWGLVERLRDAGKRLYVPRAEPRDRQLHVHPYPCELATLSFGLRQPPRGAPELPLEAVSRAVDVALVLGLGFDHQGFRLGYGSGYFDRFLAGQPFPAVALAFDLQLVDELPAEPHDVPMAVVVTESGIRRPAAS